MQTVGAMRNLETAMGAVGVDWDDIVRRTIYTAQPTEYETITRAIDEVTGGADHPAQTIVGITGLAVPGCLIEIECTAVICMTPDRPGSVLDSPLPLAKERAMRFGLYSELQCHPWQTYEQVYGETLEQVANADRLGFDCYSIIEHWFFDRFGISANPFAFFATAAARTSRIRFRTLLHVLPYHNPAVLAGQIAQMDLLTGGRYEFGVGRGHAWLPNKAGVPLDETRARYEEAFDILMGLLDNQDGFWYEGEFWKIDNARVVPRSQTERFRIFTGGTSDRTYELAAERGWGVVVPPLLPTRGAAPAARDLPRALCQARERARHRLHPSPCTWTRTRRLRPPRGRSTGSTTSSRATPRPRPELPSADELNATGYGFYASGALAGPRRRWPGEQLTRVGTPSGPGTPDQVIEKIEAVVGEVRRAGRDRGHRQRGRRRALEGDQDAGAVRRGT